MLRGFYMSDTGAPSGADSQSSAETQKTDSEQQQTSTSEHMIPKARFDEINRELVEARKWRQQREQADEVAKKKQQKDADEQAQQKGEFEKLAVERQTRLDALEQQQASTSERLQALTDAMEKQIRSRLKALPDELRDLVPDEADVLTRYDLIGKAEIAAQKLAPAQVQPRTAGTPAGPQGNGARSTAGQPDLVTRKKADGDYAL